MLSPVLFSMNDSASSAGTALATIGLASKSPLAVVVDDSPAILADAPMVASRMAAGSNMSGEVASFNNANGVGDDWAVSLFSKLTCCADGMVSCSSSLLFRSLVRSFCFSKVLQIRDDDAVVRSVWKAADDLNVDMVEMVALAVIGEGVVNAMTALLLDELWFMKMAQAVMATVALLVVVRERVIFSQLLQ